jgi:hypothetical protein
VLCNAGSDPARTAGDKIDSHLSLLSAISAQPRYAAGYIMGGGQMWQKSGDEVLPLR